MKFKLYIIAFLLMPLQICAQSKSTDSSRIHKDTYLITYGRNGHSVYDERISLSS